MDDIRCGDYVGVTCVNGFCPIANREEYAERGYDVIYNCNECPFYNGCKDCALFDTELCEGKV